MKTTLFSLLVASTASVASAASIRSYFNRDCTGGYLSFPNVNDRQCAQGVRSTDQEKIPGTQSIKFMDVATEAQLFGWRSSEKEYYCGELTAHMNLGNQNLGCLEASEDDGFEGASWAKKDDEQKCDDSITPVWLTLDDRHKYSLRNMSLTMYSDLYVLAAKGTTYDKLPDVYDDYEVAESED